MRRKNKACHFCLRLMIRLEASASTRNLIQSSSRNTAKRSNTLPSSSLSLASYWQSPCPTETAYKRMCTKARRLIWHIVRRGTFYDLLTVAGTLCFSNQILWEFGWAGGQSHNDWRHNRTSFYLGQSVWPCHLLIYHPVCGQGLSSVCTCICTTHTGDGTQGRVIVEAYLTLFAIKIGRIKNDKHHIGTQKGNSQIFEKYQNCALTESRADCEICHNEVGWDNCRQWGQPSPLPSSQSWY